METMTTSAVRRPGECPPLLPLYPSVKNPPGYEWVLVRTECACPRPGANTTYTWTWHAEQKPSVIRVLSWGQSFDLAHECAEKERDAAVKRCTEALASRDEWSDAVVRLRSDLRAACAGQDVAIKERDVAIKERDVARAGRVAADQDRKDLWERLQGALSHDVAVRTALCAAPDESTLDAARRATRERTATRAALRDIAYTATSATTANT
jgi:hypothetical protein